MESAANIPPEILSWTDGTVWCPDDVLEKEGEDVLCMVQDLTLLYVTAKDDDGDTLTFIWEGSASGPIGNAQTTLSGDWQVSQVQIQKAAVVDGEQIRCHVSDGSSDEKKQVWTIRVL